MFFKKNFLFKLKALCLTGFPTPASIICMNRRQLFEHLRGFGYNLLVKLYYYFYLNENLMSASNFFTTISNFPIHCQIFYFSKFKTIFYLEPYDGEILFQNYEPNRKFKIWNEVSSSHDSSYWRFESWFKPAGNF